MTQATESERRAEALRNEHAEYRDSMEFEAGQLEGKIEQLEAQLVKLNTRGDYRLQLDVAEAQAEELRVDLEMATQQLSTQQLSQLRESRSLEQAEQELADARSVLVFLCVLVPTFRSPPPHPPPAVPCRLAATPAPALTSYCRRHELAVMRAKHESLAKQVADQGLEQLELEHKRTELQAARYELDELRRTAAQQGGEIAWETKRADAAEQRAEVAEGRAVELESHAFNQALQELATISNERQDLYSGIPQALRTLSSGITEGAEIESQSEIFRKLDRDHNGSLSLGEFIAPTSSTPPPLPSSAMCDGNSQAYPLEQAQLPRMNSAETNRRELEAGATSALSGLTMTSSPDVDSADTLYPIASPSVSSPRVAAWATSSSPGSKSTRDDRSLAIVGLALNKVYCHISESSEKERSTLVTLREVERSGESTLELLNVTMHQLGLRMSNTDLEQMRTVLDENADGQIGADEFLLKSYLGHLDVVRRKMNAYHRRDDWGSFFEPRHVQTSEAVVSYKVFRRSIRGAGRVDERVVPDEELQRLFDYIGVHAADGSGKLISIKKFIAFMGSNNVLALGKGSLDEAFAQLLLHMERAGKNPSTCFYAWDTDEDDILRMDEFVSEARKLRTNASDATLKLMFQSMDSTGDGNVTSSEFCSRLRQIKHGSAKTPHSLQPPGVSRHVARHTTTTHQRATPTRPPPTTRHIPLVSNSTSKHTPGDRYAASSRLPTLYRATPVATPSTPVAHATDYARQRETPSLYSHLDSPRHASPPRRHAKSNFSPALGNRRAAPPPSPQVSRVHHVDRGWSHDGALAHAKQKHSSAVRTKSPEAQAEKYLPARLQNGAETHTEPAVGPEVQEATPPASEADGEIAFKISTTYDADLAKFTYCLNLPSGNIDLDTAIAAAITIQACWQGFVARERFIQLQGDHAAAVVIQSHMRRKLVKNHPVDTPDDLDDEELLDALNHGEDPTRSTSLDLGAFL